MKKQISQPKTIEIFLEPISIGVIWLNKILIYKDALTNETNKLKKILLKIKLKYARHNFKIQVKRINNINIAISFMLNINGRQIPFIYNDLKIKKKYSIKKSFIKVSFNKNKEADIYISFTKSDNTHYTYTLWMHQNYLVNHNNEASLCISTSTETKNYFVRLEELEKFPETKIFLDIIKKAILKFTE